ncbi:MAG: hypothetical protein KFKLKKLM_02299 [Flavobacteriales bacterium]|nr:hypothetical protein [Flavobacteriales bacterium]
MKAKIELAVDNIGDSLIKCENKYKDDFLLPSGKIGISLFLYYSGKFLNKDSFLEFSRYYFEECFETLNTFSDKINGRTLYGGYTGILWLFQHYINIGFIEYNEDAKSVFDVFDELIKKEFFVEKQIKNYDLLYGLLGYGVYFLERNKLKNQVRVLNDVVSILDEISIKKEYGITWEDRFERKENKDKELINLGFAHGVPSIIVFLSYVYKETGNKEAVNLIHKAIDFLKYHELDTSKESCFSYNILNEQPDKYPSRLAWCYGDLGIGYAILKSGVLISNPNYIKYGEEILLNLVGKTLQDEVTGVKDAGFCHGASGIAHLLYKAFKYTNNISFYKSSEYWIEIALSMQDKDGGYSRYHYSDNEKRWQYEPDNGLLEGASGVGLCLISHVISDELYWDSCFLL